MIVVSDSGPLISLMKAENWTFYEICTAKSGFLKQFMPS